MSEAIVSAYISRKLALVLPIVFIFEGCIEPFDGKSTDYENSLVVDAAIFDTPGPYQVLLSRSRPFGTSNSLPQTGASVCVTTPEGVCYPFTEVAPGKYLSDSAEWRGQPGTTYKLEIDVNGIHFESSEELLRSTPAIDSVYYELEERYTDAEEVLSGIALFVDTHDENNSTKFYKWTSIESWEIKVEFPIDYNLWTCYDSDTSKIIQIATTRGLSKNVVSRHELNYVSTEGFRLGSYYSLLVKQSAIDQKAYSYWSEIKQSTEMAGSLFDIQHYPIRGNIYNTSDAEEVVLGYFEVLSIQDKRIFISRRDVKDLNFPGPSCYSVWDGPPSDPRFLPRRCTDCTYHGGSLKKPDFWPN
ncbi:DUF4249 domain-containing protein [uncultured Imperialibacter sp.]|uniref:DUF4249 domain-containing protein n=1 Tax=uncultured Imperialibacter sp. TaxID=1672639 RepID=UPI0030DC525C|tara:strand:- start:1093 stop:2166 length:1074 start_codon:yes stop_codon:yes gene_type:complete